MGCRIGRADGAELGVAAVFGLALRVAGVFEANLNVVGNYFNLHQYGLMSRTLANLIPKWPVQAQAKKLDRQPPK